MSREGMLRITTLVDNCAAMPEIGAEHGLSILIQKDGKKILFDCGQSSLIEHNARKLNLGLEGLEAVVLSHGHYDHCGGLMAVVKKNPGVKVYGHPGIFEKKYVKYESGLRYIGIKEAREHYEREGAEFVLSAHSLEIGEGIYTTGQVPRVTDFEYVDSSFVKKAEGDYIKDEIVDDISLVIEWKDGLILILGCAHSGVVNILRKVHNLCPKDLFLLVMGGMHLSQRDDSYVEKTLKEISKEKIGRIIPMHCSGISHSALFAGYFGSRFEYGSAGMVLDFKEG